MSKDLKKVKVSFYQPHQLGDLVRKMKPLDGASDEYVVGFVTEEDLESLRKDGMTVELIERRI